MRGKVENEQQRSKYKSLENLRESWILVVRPVPQFLALRQDDAMFQVFIPAPKCEGFTQRIKTTERN